VAKAAKTKAASKGAGNGSINKAEEIRKAAEEIGGKKVRPKDVIAALAAKGITVAPAQVSSTLKAAGYRRLRRKKTTSASAGQKPPKDGITLDHILAAKALIGKVGSVEAAKQAIEVWSRLN
jgi:hypothetical protein